MLANSTALLSFAAKSPFSAATTSNFLAAICASNFPNRKSHARLRATATPTVLSVTSSIPPYTFPNTWKSLFDISMLTALFHSPGQS